MTLSHQPKNRIASGFPLPAILPILLLPLVLLCHQVRAEEFERPTPPDGGPTLIEGWFAVFDVDDINDADQNFTVKLYTEFSWLDPSLAHNGTKVVVKQLSEVWHPEISFFNMQRSWGESPKEVEVEPDGMVRFEEHRWGHFSQPLSLNSFPFDSQSFEIRAIANATTEDVKFIPSKDQTSFVDSGYSVADWEMTDSGIANKPYVLPDGQQVSSLTFTIFADRLSHFYTIKVISPLVLIILISWVVFWLDPKEGGSQLGIAVTSFLTVIAFHISLSSLVPKIPYLTRLDIFVFGGTLLVFLAVIEVVITTNWARSNRLKSARNLDWFCRLAFPIALVLISVYSFKIH